MKLVDYKCRHDDSEEKVAQVIAASGLKFPQVHQSGQEMATLSKLIKEAQGDDFCMLPFCHTVEGEALGGRVNLGDAINGPRAKAYVCNSMEDILALETIDFSTGRIAEVIRAASYLVENGEEVVLYLSGPFTILNVLMDPTKVFKAFRKTPELMDAVFNKLQDELLAYVKIMRASGVKVVSYADSSGGLNILGPKFFEQTMDMFTVEILKKISSTVGNEGLVILCPKTTLGLISSGRADWGVIEVTLGATYRKACISATGKAQFIGETCIKNPSYTVRNGQIRTVLLR